MIYQIYYDRNSSNEIVTGNPIVVPFGVYRARSLPRKPGYLYDDERVPNLTDHNTLCEWRVLFYIWKHRPAPWVGFTSWSHNRKGFVPRIESILKEQCESILKFHNIIGFYAQPLRKLIAPIIAQKCGLTLKVQFTQWSIMEQMTGRANFDKRMLPLGKYHHIDYWDFVIREFKSHYGVDLEKDLDFQALGDIPALHTWCNAFVANWAYFNDYMTTFSPIVFSMIDHFGNHPTELELAYICERLIILHNYIKYTNHEFKIHPRSYDCNVVQACQGTTIQKMPSYESVTLPTPVHAEPEDRCDLPSGLSIVRKIAPFSADMQFQGGPIGEHGHAFVSKKKNECSQVEREAHNPEQQAFIAPSLFLGLIKGENYGWGVCSRYLIQEISKIRSVRLLHASDGSAENSALGGVLFQALINVDFDPMFPNARAQRNFGYTFFENELTRRSTESAKRFDKVLGGSSWCLERMREKGIANSDILIQGVDPEIFFPIDDPSDPERFVIFSGGKFELRKGQDLVLRAVKIMQDKYPDVWLVNCWYNLWPDSMRLMCHSPHIQFEYRQNERWSDTMQRTYETNGLDSRRIVTCEMMPQELQRHLYARTDVGLFPNRCEGGTNLVLMEYMACGKPVIASYASGHKDIVNSKNAMLLHRLVPFRVVNSRQELIAAWQNPSLDEIVACLEYAYHHRQEMQRLGHQAGMDLKNFTWAHSARQLLLAIAS